MQNKIYDALRGKTALVTGASSGIGAALARRLGAAEVNVVCTARTQADLDLVVNDILSAGGNAIAVAGDATLPEHSIVLAEKIAHHFQGLDYAFLNAGGNVHKAAIVDSDFKQWRAALDLNVAPVFLGIQLAVPLMIKNGGGRIVFTGSAMAHYAGMNNSSYCAGKAAARMIAQTAALELAEHNITVNEFIPGPVRSKQALAGYDKNDKNSVFNNHKEWVKEPEDVVDMLMMMVAYPGMGPTSQIFSLARR